MSNKSQQNLKLRNKNTNIICVTDGNLYYILPATRNNNFVSFFRYQNISLISILLSHILFFL